MEIKYAGTILALEKDGNILGGSEVLRNIDLAIAKGEVISVVSPSGSRKSTLVALHQLFSSTGRDGSA